MVNPINIPSASSVPQSPPTITPTTIISDVDLLRCTRHIRENISILAGSLGITSADLQEIQRDYKEVETQAYWVLKKWQESVSNNVQHKELHDKLEVLGFNNAAKRYYCLWINNNIIITIYSLMNPEMPPPSQPPPLPPSPPPSICVVM